MPELKDFSQEIKQLQEVAYKHHHQGNLCFGECVESIKDVEKVLRQSHKRLLEEVKKEVVARKSEHHKKCLSDEFVNGRFWEADDIFQYLHSLIKELE